ncbi:HNH endonuclease signature motif containing protein [Granulicella cerasi]|uniref:HNH endonuclease signature motif containing protein n=1 Tax=Granulicella cerasi TaxID=741063 RepID=A0ABW1Z9T1_9BACT|nr:HNH endonuclease signature motif containing protein [Granulicella cerasi]
MSSSSHQAKTARRLAESGWLRPEQRERGPNGLPLCRWCRLEILAKRRRTFCSEYCVHQWRLRSDPGYLRDQVFLRDRGICALCSSDTVAEYARLKRSRGNSRAIALEMWGLRSVTARRSLWDADHIRPVAEGGGECDLDNLRTLCLMCHREATAELRLRLKGRVAVRLPSEI